MIDLFSLSESLESAQRCQRNWDLSRSIPVDILATLKEVVKKSPTKQNEAYYSVIFCTNREVIQRIYDNTLRESALGNTDINKNSQVLAPLVVLFCSTKPPPQLLHNESDSLAELAENQKMSIGIVSGQIALVANMLGLKTGFCKCFDRIALKNITEGTNVELLLGIGYPDTNKNRKEHQNVSIQYGSYDKHMMFKSITDTEQVTEMLVSGNGQGNYSITVLYDYSNVTNTSGVPYIRNYLINQGFTITNEVEQRLLLQKIATDHTIVPGFTTEHDVGKKTIIHRYHGNSTQNLKLFKANLLTHLNSTIYFVFLKQQGWIIL